ncbi:outer membrane protein OmpA-like peptidoglycan-associated protein [Prosthecobacter fusiformis]|uniref:Outer membrane protein OmpA-like peptidoglycan-associated protein n=2 Tax=Prosthecobacter fusiformis TaxID=48464 RepID=A0A4R7RMI5_9BACT|nr:outer membrane protein OmpA-like peptidoglycan-associated protein [Prosthecobacter fusiformis]
MKTSLSFWLVATSMVALNFGHAQTSPEFTKDAPGSKDHPILKRIEGSVILKYATKKFDSHQVALGPVIFDYAEQKTKEWKKIDAEGARTTLFYRAPADASTLECLRSYQADLKEKGFEILFEGYSGGKPQEDGNTLDNGYGRFVAGVYKTETDYGLQEYTLPGSEDFRYTAMKKTGEGGAGDVYVTIFAAAVTDSWKDPEKGILAGTVVARVDVIETQAMQNRMVMVKADEMEKQITTTGRVALYGIYFDTNKATLKPESDETLAEVQKLMSTDPGIKLLVVGHTDNVGEFEFNRDLSNRRAAAVVEALTSRYGISSQRLFPFGCSFASPAAPNATEDGRTKNRRVELVKWN